MKNKNWTINRKSFPIADDEHILFILDRNCNRLASLKQFNNVNKNIFVPQISLNQRKEVSTMKQTKKGVERIAPTNTKRTIGITKATHDALRQFIAPDRNTFDHIINYLINQANQKK